MLEKLDLKYAFGDRTFVYSPVFVFQLSNGHTQLHIAFFVGLQIYVSYYTCTVEN